jgi:P27 family predicted phage terminase small subunit
MARGRPPKPTTLHWLAGDPSRDRRYTTEPTATGTPEPPEHFDAIARAEWDDMVRLLSAMGLLGAVDGKALALYCDCYRRYRTACEFVAVNGAYNEKGNQNGANKDIHLCQNEMRAWLVEFGCTPSARARMRIKPKGAAKKSKWAGIIPTNN